jgi:Arc/MetJ-type ribon-helix-helix transcriptional regulator
MATVVGVARKVTIAVDESQYAAVRELVPAGQSRSVSGFVRHAIDIALDDVTDWDAQLADALARTGGPLTAEELAWADEVLGVGRSSSLDQRNKGV